ncbi:uncharacterized protein PFL1_06376 [Pseudozyma flocculosa PF-1]|uniref:NAD-dependent epimerase/dehydratase domain-containing protein n=1 Tax=Pseudozyma flocculosa PF-1 TaxID=1277687 RepID=A0A061H1Z2_9BASI|nr:uncharacterized protein PFL1_06376 [Pseudozyma flocculosa PF-1]EPQ26169.1 hypothetical protein PFL1_06376 [Pseudozyma flocculosa PF-1]
MTKLLVTGATGYIGGSILTTLLRDAHAAVAEYGVLVRNKAALDTFQSRGVKAHLFDGLDDLATIEDVASQYDIVVNTASASHPESAKALIRGLSRRSRPAGSNASIVHTSGTSILGDHAEGRRLDERIFSDVDDDLYAFEAGHPEPYSQRITDVAVVDTAAALGVRSYIVVPPTIYGKGSGWFATISQQIPHLTRLALRQGQAVCINEGLSAWNHIHIDDVADFYSFLLARILADDDASVGHGRREGYYFVQDGEHTWSDVSRAIGAQLHARGLIKTPELIRLGFSSNARARDDRARALGWSPRRHDFEEHYQHEIATVAAEADFSSP